MGIADLHAITRLYITLGTVTRAISALKAAAHQPRGRADSMLCQKAQQRTLWRRRRGLTWKG